MSCLFLAPQESLGTIGGGASIFWVPLPGFPPPFYLAVKRKEVLGVPVAAQQFKNLTCCILVSLRM